MLIISGRGGVCSSVIWLWSPSIQLSPAPPAFIGVVLLLQDFSALLVNVCASCSSANWSLHQGNVVHLPWFQLPRRLRPLPSLKRVSQLQGCFLFSPELPTPHLGDESICLFPSPQLCSPLLISAWHVAST